MGAFHFVCDMTGLSGFALECLTVEAALVGGISNAGTAGSMRCASRGLHFGSDTKRKHRIRKVLRHRIAAPVW